MLLVDGHNSHYTQDFLNYARQNNIHILCYPAHATHIYQGLDVVVFGPLKRYWTQEWDEYEQTKRRRVDKTNFISLYGKAHRKALTLETIRTAFRKTGIWPFNPKVVTQDMMAPSLETSSLGQLPLPQPSPVKEVLHVIREHGHTKDVLYLSPVRALTNVICQYHNDQTGTAQPQWNTLIKDAVDSLTTTSAAFLVCDTPITSQDHLPIFTSTPFTPTRKQKHSILDREPETEFERECQDALRDAYEHEAGYKGALYGMQSTVVLQGMFCDRMSSQLAAVEEKKKGKSGSS